MDGYVPQRCNLRRAVMHAVDALIKAAATDTALLRVRTGFTRIHSNMVRYPFEPAEAGRLVLLLPSGALTPTLFLLETVCGQGSGGPMGSGRASFSLSMHSEGSPLLCLA